MLKCPQCGMEQNKAAAECLGCGFPLKAGLAAEEPAPTIEPGSKNEPMPSLSERLGYLTGIPGVDPENVPMFAKTSRIIGLVTLAAFILWGLTYNWKYGDSPFRALAENLGYYKNAGEYYIAAASATIGWFFRFSLGVLTFMALSGLVSGVSRIGRAIIKAI